VFNSILSFEAADVHVAHPGIDWVQCAYDKVV